MIKKYFLVSLLLITYNISCNDIAELEKQLNELSFLQQVRAEQYAPELAKKDNKTESSTVILPHGVIMHTEHSEPNTLALQLKREMIQKELSGISKEALLTSLLEHENKLLILKQKLLPLYEKKNSEILSQVGTSALASLCLAGLTYYASSSPEKVLIVPIEVLVLCACMIAPCGAHHDDTSLKNSIAASEDIIKTIEILQQLKAKTN